MTDTHGPNAPWQEQPDGTWTLTVGDGAGLVTAPRDTTMAERARLAAAWSAQPAPAPAGTEATGVPDTITDPAYLRDLYAAAMLRVFAPSRPLVTPEELRIVDELTTAVLRVRDRHLQQLRQRLTLAAAVLDQTQERPAGHIYLSTGCLHGDTVLPDGRTGHEYCQSETGKTGTKTPAQCKFCASPCVCPCHEEQPGA